MGNKVDLEEVIALSNDLDKATEGIKESLADVETSVDSLISLSSFSGEAATSAKNYFQDLHLTVLTVFANLFTDLNDSLKQHIDSFQAEVDASESALIKTDYLLDKEADVEEDFDDLLAEWENVRDIINSVSDISSTTPPTFYDVNVAKNDVVNTLTELEEDLETFTSKGKEELTDIESLLENIERTINDAGAVSGNERFFNYTGASMTLGLPVLQAYNDGKQAEAHEEMMMKAEHAKDAAIQDMDGNYTRVFNDLYNAFKSGEIDEEQYYEELHTIRSLENDEAIVKHLQEMDKEDLAEDNAVKAFLGSNLYSRFRDTASLADFTVNFSEKIQDAINSSPALAKVLNESDELRGFIKRAENLSDQIKSHPTAGKHLVRFSKTDKVLGAFKDIGSNKYIKAGISGLRAGAEAIKGSKIGSAITKKLGSKTITTFGSNAKKLLNAGGKVGWVGTAASLGLDGYYNVRNDEVQGDFALFIASVPLSAAQSTP